MAAGEGLMADRFAGITRVVIKIGSALLVNESRGELKRDWLKALCADIAALKTEGKDVILVSSGAVALGRRHLGLSGKLKLEEKQAAAAIGQIRLAGAYQEMLAGFGIAGAQILLTIGDTEQRRRYLNARGTINTLLSFGAIPVINENDSVATSEIRFGDNDRLAARVAQMAGAELLLLLSDIDGLYTADPRRDPAAQFIPEVEAVTPQIEAMAGTARVGYGSGGMITKLKAAKICTAAGCHMAILNGTVEHPIQRYRETGRGTWFKAAATPLASRKLWISGILLPLGTITIDTGAVTALKKGSSLLHAGVKAVEGAFSRGDPVRVVDTQGREIARGLSAYDSADAERLKGHKTAEIEAILGYSGRVELIHRDDMVLSRF
jgi:glutamate 5-kinase